MYLYPGIVKLPWKNYGLIYVIHESTVNLIKCVWTCIFHPSWSIACMQLFIYGIIRHHLFSFFRIFGKKIRRNIGTFFRRRTIYDTEKTISAYQNARILFRLSVALYIKHYKYTHILWIYFIRYKRDNFILVR